MNAQSLDCSASSSRSARSRRAGPESSACSSAARACQAKSATAGPLQVRRSPPSPQLLAPSSAGAGPARGARARRRAWSAPSPGASASSITAASQSTPSYHQWPNSSVSNAQTQTPAVAHPLPARGDEIACVCGRQRRARVAVVGAAVVGPQPVVVRRSAGGSRGSGRATGSRPRPRPATISCAVDRPQHRPVVGLQRPQVARVARPKPRSAPRTWPARPPPRAARRATARARTRAARSRRAQSPKRRRWDAIPVASCSAIPESLASSGSTACVAAEVQLACGAAPRAARRRRAREPVGRGGVFGGRALELAHQRSAPPADSSRVQPVRLRRTSRRKRRQRSIAPGASSWSHSTGVSDSVIGAPRASTSSSGR